MRKHPTAKLLLLLLSFALFKTNGQAANPNCAAALNPQLPLEDQFLAFAWSGLGDSDQLVFGKGMITQRTINLQPSKTSSKTDSITVHRAGKMYFRPITPQQPLEFEYGTQLFARLKAGQLSGQGNLNSVQIRGIPAEAEWGANFFATEELVGIYAVTKFDYLNEPGSGRPLNPQKIDPMEMFRFVFISKDPATSVLKIWAAHPVVGLVFLNIGIQITDRSAESVREEHRKIYNEANAI